MNAVAELEQAIAAVTQDQQRFPAGSVERQQLEDKVNALRRERARRTMMGGADE